MGYHDEILNLAAGTLVVYRRRPWYFVDRAQWPPSYRDTAGRKRVSDHVIIRHVIHTNVTRCVKPGAVRRVSPLELLAFEAGAPEGVSCG